MSITAGAQQDDVLDIRNASDHPMAALQLGEPDITPPTAYRTSSTLNGLAHAQHGEPIKTIAPRRSGDVGAPVLSRCRPSPKPTSFTNESAFRADRQIAEFHGQCRTSSATSPSSNI